MRSQRTFKTSAGSLTGCSKPTTKDQILNAEILQALNILDKNHSYSSANGDSSRFKKMFPDSQIGIDGPNVSKSFKSKLAEELQKRGATHFLDVGTCSIHIANNTFLEGIKYLKDNVNVDQFAIDLHFVFKLSAARREDDRGVSELTDVTTHYVIKHSHTRWLSLDKVLVRIIEQYENLKEYFLITLPTLLGFKGKNGVSQTERYQRIRNVLTSKAAIAYMSFSVHVCQDFKEFVLPLQSTEPKIHVLYTKCFKLVKDLPSKFVKNDSFMKQTKLLPKEEIIQAINQRKMQRLSFIFLYPRYFVHFIYSTIPSPF